MRKFVRRVATVAMAATAAVALASAPAHAATNPYTPGLACNNDFGGTWAPVSDGHRSIDYSGHLGDVYLMYNKATGFNCVTTIKAAFVGTPTIVTAKLEVQGGASVIEGTYFKYYAAVQASARDHCVWYEGGMVSGSSFHAAARYTWGNCG